MRLELDAMDMLRFGGRYVDFLKYTGCFEPGSHRVLRVTPYERRAFYWSTVHPQLKVSTIEGFPFIRLEALYMTAFNACRNFVRRARKDGRLAV